MGTILHPNEFAEALRRFRGVTPEGVEEFLNLYPGAARAAEAALPRLPPLGFFSSERERVGAFLAVCRFLDELVGSGSITIEEGQVALCLMMASDKSFHRAIKAFTNYSYRFRNERLATTESQTADTYFKSMGGPC